MGLVKFVRSFVIIIPVLDPTDPDEDPEDPDEDPPDPLDLML